MRVTVCGLSCLAGLVSVQRIPFGELHLLFASVCVCLLLCCPVNEGLEVTSGSSFCQIDENGCATDGAGDHGNDEACTVRVNAAGTLTFAEFDVEPDDDDGEDSADSERCPYDYIQIGGTRYCNGVGHPPSHIFAVAAGSTFTWQSDGSVTHAGWTICFSETHARAIQIYLASFSLSLDHAWGVELVAACARSDGSALSPPPVRFRALAADSTCTSDLDRAQTVALHLKQPSQLGSTG